MIYLLIRILLFFVPAVEVAPVPRLVNTPREVAVAFVKPTVTHEVSTTRASTDTHEPTPRPKPNIRDEYIAWKSNLDTYTELRQKLLATA